MTNIKQAIEELTRKFAADLGAVIREGVMGAIGSGAAAPLKRNIPPHCVYDGCKDKHSGPRFHFLCGKHQASWKAPKK